MTMSDCPVAALLSKFGNGDRAQLVIVVNDRTRNPHLIARSLDPDLTGIDVMRHQHHTCTCFGYTD